MKLLVKTSGNHQLVNVLTGQLIRWNRPTVVPTDGFIDRELANGQLTLVKSGLPDEASDAEFAKYWSSCDGDEEMAVASYLSKFEPEAETPTNTTPAKKNGKG